MVAHSHKNLASEEKAITTDQKAVNRAYRQVSLYFPLEYTQQYTGITVHLVRIVCLDCVYFVQRFRPADIRFFALRRFSYSCT